MVLVQKRERPVRRTWLVCVCLRSLTKLVADLDDLLSSGTENILYPSECSVWRTGSHTGAAGCGLCFDLMVFTLPPTYKKSARRCCEGELTSAPRATRREKRQAIYRRRSWDARDGLFEVG